MTVLITGAGGFIGSHLVEAQLKKGKRVRALDLDLSILKPWVNIGDLELIHGNIRNRDLMVQALKGIDVVFHLASAHLSVRAPEEAYWEVNVRAAEELVRLCQLAGVKRFVHCSTVGIYGNLTHLPGDEESPLNPDLIYEKTKLAGERAVLRVAQETGCPVTIVRPVWVYGPRCPRTAKLFRAIRKRTFIMLGDGRTLRHCVYISDMVDGFDLCAQRDEAIGQSFIIGDQSAITVEELVHEIAAVVQAPPPKIRLPVGLMAPACIALEALFKLRRSEPPLSTRTLKFFTNNTSFDITKAQRLLGFAPQVSLNDGLKRTYDYLLQHDQIH
jgi:nucleoside-diphosphate-sugar epimerase